MDEKKEATGAKTVVVAVAGEAQEAPGAREVVAAGEAEAEGVEDGDKVEAEMSKRYDIPIEVLRVGLEKHLRDMPHDCVPVSSFQQFGKASASPALAALPLHMYLMPYLPPRDAGMIKDELRKAMLHKVVLCNPELLHQKNTILLAIASLKSQQQLSLAAEPDRSLSLRKYRRLVQGRLLVAHALQGAADGNMSIAHSLLRHTYPGLYHSIPKDQNGELEEMALMERLAEIRETVYGDPQEDETEEISKDLMDILATEDWEDQKKISANLELHEDLLTDIADEPSLIGAADSGMAATVLGKQLHSLVSSLSSKGLLGDDFVDIHLLHGSVATKVLVNNFCANGHTHISELITLLDQRQVDFSRVITTAQIFHQSATDACAQQVKTMCEQFNILCEKKDDVGCIKKIINIKDEFDEISPELNTILELQSLIQHYDPKAR